MDNHIQLLLEILLFLYFLRAGHTCPQSCVCLSRNVWCENKSLRSVPLDIPDNTRQLYLFDNNITTIPQTSLSSLKNLELLVFNNNRLRNKALNSGTLNNLGNLQSLDLSSNQLTIISTTTFAGMPKLKRLYLENNKISYIDRDAFNNMTKLIELKLTNNLLNTFPIITGCTKLARLYLSHNRINQLYNNFQSVNLEQLEIADNGLTQFSGGLFDRINNLRELDLSENKLTTLPLIIENMTSLHFLNLSGNPIRLLPGNMLNNLRKIKLLDLSNMKLETLDDGFIPRGVWPNIISLSNNPWKCTCDIMWITNMMRSTREVFTDIDYVVCQNDPEGAALPIENLNANSMGCEKMETPLTPTFDGCDVLSCANDGTCIQNETTNKPMCLCSDGWKGVLCNIPVITYDFDDKPTPNSNLKVDSASLTGHSVVVFLPEVDEVLKISVKEVKDPKSTSPQFVLTKEIVVEPEENPYLVEGLTPSKTYNICVSTLKSNDQTCSTVVTNDEDEPTSSLPSPPVINVDDGDPNKSRIAGQNNEPTVDSSNKSHMFELLYPILGAILGALVIVVMVVVFYMCHRDKNKLKQAELENKLPMYSARYTPAANIIEDSSCGGVVSRHDTSLLHDTSCCELPTSTSDRVYPYSESPVMFTSNGGYNLNRDAYQPIPIKPCPVPANGQYLPDRGSTLQSLPYSRSDTDNRNNFGPVTNYYAQPNGYPPNIQQKPMMNGVGGRPASRQRTTSHPPIYRDERCTSRASDIERRDHSTTDSAYTTSIFTENGGIRTPQPSQGYHPNNSLNFHRNNPTHHHVIAHPGLPPSAYAQSPPVDMVTTTSITPGTMPRYSEGR